jgi:hypothetical protein
VRIITAGGNYPDIDVYGGIIAYAELMKLLIITLGLRAFGMR